MYDSAAADVSTSRAPFPERDGDGIRAGRQAAALRWRNAAQSRWPLRARVRAARAPRAACRRRGAAGHRRAAAQPAGARSGASPRAPRRASRGQCRHALCRHQGLLAGTPSPQPCTPGRRLTRFRAQLSGGHRGDPATDRTSGDKAVADFDAFVRAGIDTFDMGPETCGYGPAESIVGDYLKTRPGGAPRPLLFTKLCCVGGEQATPSAEWVRGRVDRALGRLGRPPRLDLLQVSACFGCLEMHRTAMLTACCRSTGMTCLTSSSWWT